ncbi:DNA polymerase III subunit delta [Priestia taiwanensis]|uniref:DNA polymerase III subunit delta n=1 Tax=Priestia taiwanensis TaxID=1347902 RepID=A0A917AUT4_9BACI|nr:DNA polymerase III subunit delta [Priestia taiwanensis]MBM7363724.1 DNA polymerase-3 subunit delta [Priestia taiwanensis]GGE74665.1 DNA polymerase III subunit delta [Priestia taiwanensis]
MSVHNDIKKGNFTPMYLLYGVESFFMDETLDLIINHAVEESDIEFNVSTYDLEESYIEEALEDATTLPFFGERKVVIVKRPLFLTAQKAKIEQNMKALEAYLESPSPFTIFVLVAPYEKLDERKKITKALKKHATVIESQSFTIDRAKEWIRQRVESNGSHIEASAAEALVELVGMNIMILANEIDKLTTFVGVDSTITRDIVYNLVPKSVEQNVFMLVERVVERNIPQALGIMYELLHKQEEPIKILGLLASQFRLLYQVKEYMRRGYGQNQIASHVGVHPFRVKLAMKQINMFSFEELYTVMDELAEADYMMKTGKLEKKLVLEFFIMKRGRKR